MIVSVILPTYNESGNIVPLVREIIQNIPSNWRFEILVVDDNSPDGTFRLVKEAFVDEARVIPILRTMDRGFAKSIRTGLEMSQGSKLLIMDTDFTHDPVEIPKMIHISKHYDIVSGSRFCPGGNMQSTRHYLASFVFNLFIRLILHTQIQDNLGGYFLIDKEKLFRLPFDEIFYGYGEYFFRLLHFAQMDKMSIVEIPAFYRSRRAGKSKSGFFHMLYTYSSAAFKLMTRKRKLSRMNKLS